MTIRPDNINFLSTLPNYISITTDDAAPTGTISISGSLANGATQDYSTTISLSADSTRADIYGTNQNTLIKQLYSNTTFPVNYQNAGGEAATLLTSYSAGSVTVTIELFNGTGGLINLTSQNITVKVVEYQIPY
jgi:hypothetical protein